MSMGLEVLREGIITKANEKAREILENAERKARELISESLRIYEERVKEAKERRIKELKEDYERKFVEELSRLNMELLKAKNEILNDIKFRVISEVSNVSPNIRKESIRGLLKEVVNSNVIRVEKGFTVYVIRKDLDLVSEVLREEGLDRIVNVRLLDDKYLGGLMVESSDGELLIDNTYLTRIDNALNLVLRKLNEYVFKGI